jgi:hypothetical protein
MKSRIGGDGAARNADTAPDRQSRKAPEAAASACTFGVDPDLGSWHPVALRASLARRKTVA